MENTLRVGLSVSHPLTGETLAECGEQVTGDLLYKLAREGADRLRVETTNQTGTPIIGILLFDIVR